jgi:hypothetical protein
MGDGHGNYCGIGHVQQVLQNEYERDLSFWNPDDEIYILFGKTKEVMSRVAVELFPDRVFSDEFSEFNDHDDTTEEDVVSVMEKAAVRFDELV